MRKFHTGERKFVVAANLRTDLTAHWRAVLPEPAEARQCPRRRIGVAITAEILRYGAHARGEGDHSSCEQQPAQHRSDEFFRERIIAGCRADAIRDQAALCDLQIGDDSALSSVVKLLETMRRSVSESVQTEAMPVLVESQDALRGRKQQVSVAPTHLGTERVDHNTIDEHLKLSPRKRAERARLQALIKSQELAWEQVLEEEKQEEEEREGESEVDGQSHQLQQQQEPVQQERQRGQEREERGWAGGQLQGLQDEDPSERSEEGLGESCSVLDTAKQSLDPSDGELEAVTEGAGAEDTAEEDDAEARR